MMILVASCERHVHTATIDVNGSIASTNAAIEKFAAKAESAVKMRRRTLELLTLRILSNVRPQLVNAVKNQVVFGARCPGHLGQKKRTASNILCSGRGGVDTCRFFKCPLFHLTPIEQV